MGNYNVEIIKCQNKIGNDTIKELHYKANAILFKLAHSYIMKSRTIRCGTELKGILTKLREHQPADGAKAKWREVINAIETQLKYLRSVVKQEPTVDEIQKTINYNVSCYLRNKPDNLQEAVNMVTEMKTLISDLGDNDLSKVNLRAFRKMGDELKAYIDKEIEISI